MKSGHLTQYPGAYAGHRCDLPRAIISKGTPSDMAVSTRNLCKDEAAKDRSAELSGIDRPAKQTLFFMRCGATRTAPNGNDASAVDSVAVPKMPTTGDLEIGMALSGFTV